MEATYEKPLTQLEQEWHQHLDSMESGNPSCHAVVNAALRAPNDSHLIGTALP